MAFDKGEGNSNVVNSNVVNDYVLVRYRLRLALVFHVY